jgi:hypothetical protein
MKKCPFCAEEIQDAAVVCRFCQRSLVTEPDTEPGPKPAPTSSAGKTIGLTILAFFGLVFLFAWFGSSCHSDPAPPARVQFNETQIAQARNVIQLARNADLIGKVEDEKGTVWVEPAVWLGMSVDAKRAVVAAFAVQFGAAGRPARASIRVFRSDRLLAWMSDRGDIELE